jgi:hypothetical protein
LEVMEVIRGGNRKLKMTLLGFTYVICVKVS